MEKLFLEKTAAGKKVSDKPGQWVKEVLTYFHDEYPQFINMPTEINFTQKNEEKGTAVGSITLKEWKLSLPIIIDEYILKPIDIAVFDGKVLPFNENTLSIMFNSKTAFIGVTKEESVERLRHIFGRDLESIEKISVLGGLNGMISDEDKKEVLMLIKEAGFKDNEFSERISNLDTNSGELIPDFYTYEKSGKWDYLVKLGNFEVDNTKEIEIDARNWDMFRKKMDKLGVNFGNNSEFTEKTAQIRSIRRNIVNFDNTKSNNKVEIDNNNNYLIKEGSCTNEGNLKVSEFLESGTFGSFILDNGISKPICLEKVGNYGRSIEIDAFDGLEIIKIAMIPGIEAAMASEDEDFDYYKVVRSTTNNNPVYPDDGYIYYSSDLDDLSYIDENVPKGKAYYRVCYIVSPKRYCSKVVTIQNKKEAKQSENLSSQKQKVKKAVKKELKMTEAHGVFKDLSETHWANDCLEKLSEKHIVSGNPDGSFKPNNPVNRAEFLKMIVLALYPNDSLPSNNQCFSDIHSTDWFSKYVCFASSKKIVSGYAGKLFKASQSISRAEAVSILAKALRLPVSNKSTCDFKDVKIDWQRKYINSASKYNLVKGYANHQFKPNSSISRVEAAKLVCNALSADISEDEKEVIQSDDYENEDVVDSEEEEQEESNKESIEVGEEGNSSDSSDINNERTEAIIINHNSVSLNQIPKSFIESAKNKFHIAYGHTSHGSQLTTGMKGIK